MISSLFSFARRPSWLRLASLLPAESHYRDEMRRAVSPIVGRITAACTSSNHHRGHPLPGSTVPVIRLADSVEVQIWHYYPVNLVYSRVSPSSLEYRSSLCALPWKHSKSLSSLLDQATPHQVTNLFPSSWGRERGLEVIRFPDMAHSKARASEVQYDVFLSFSGADTRFDFTDFLNRDLNNAGIRVFRDEDAIEVGDKIGETILQAIDNSKIYIPIISQTYPDREWCLIELEHMMYNVFRSNGKKRIFPIFYKVEPGHVKHRTPRPKNLSSEEALAKVGQIKGWKVEEGQSQAKIVDLVVRKVLEELGRKDESQTEHPIELDDLTQSLEDSYNRAVMRYAGRESLSRGSIGRGTSRSSTSTERRWSNLSINRMEGMDMEEASVSTGRSGIKGSLSINRMEDMYTEEGSGSTGGEVEAAEGLAAAEEGGAGAVEAAGIAAGKRKRGKQ
ncbi:disease resistance protein RPP4 isoform X1 [Eucalyptus grandis]|uniref:disease resistance protein RPP4 isoform X1 n=1 Tax=Eucalyptus grandis TaxID=71139 RepID=UPI00192EB8BD|nr:disease resistance protein RPP4 isoform X1 [Eucalyptus grandis]XP_039167024.1 disease resistance protein RPP4 isoform X1 [Eucalyptus grandis]XP_039167027.1 disease resistance protein RPP4 isoform X1 [Eucalyptus grandis]XP_039167033.1 disease resistance protein RPP4 isoform X1 [Eucalyptus grandis]